MKILMLGWELPPHNSGGLGVACLNLAKRLADSGANIEFILPYSDYYDIDFMKVVGVSNFKSKDSKSMAYNSSTKNKYIVGERLFIEKVLSTIGERQFDIIHANDWLTFRAAIRAKEKTGWPLIAHVHSIESDRSGGVGNPIVRDVEQVTFLIADRIVAVSEHTRQRIIYDYGVPHDKISVVHNSIDINDFKPLVNFNSYYYINYLKNNGYKIVCNVGRQTLQKGLPNLLQAAQQVLKFEPKTFFLFVGDGDQNHELIEMAAELGISRNVLFTGFQRGKQVRDAFAIGDLFVMPSVSEPFGLTPLEAIGYGTPTLITKQSGVSEVLHNTLLVNFWDINEMANQIIAAIRSVALNDSLLANAQKEVENLSWQQPASKVMDIYRDFIKVTA